MCLADNRKLVEILGENFLWEIVCNYIAHDVCNLKCSLRQLNYPSSDDIDKISRAEVLESEEFIIRGFTENEGILTVTFEMPAIITAENDNSHICCRVTACCVGSLKVPDINSFDWNSLNLTDLRKKDIVSLSHLVKEIRLSYEDTEADDMNA